MLPVESNTCARALWQGLVCLMSRKGAGEPEQVTPGGTQPRLRGPSVCRGGTWPWAPARDGCRTGDTLASGQHQDSAEPGNEQLSLLGDEPGPETVNRLSKVIQPRLAPRVWLSSDPSFLFRHGGGGRPGMPG